MISFILGETRYINMSVSSTKGEKVIVTDATYKIFCDDEIVNAGDCEINDSDLSILYTPAKKGAYMLEINYTVPPETRIGRCYFNVN